MLFARPVAVFLCLTPFRISLARKGLHLLGRAARRGRNLSGVDPACWCGLPKADLYFDIAFVVVLDVAPDPGLDHRVCGAAPARRAAAPRSHAAPRRARSAGPARAGDRRLSGWPPTAPICGAGCCRPGHGRRWWCATRKSSVPPRPTRCGRATISISWRRPRRRRRSTASSSTCRRRHAPDPRLLGDFFVTGDHTLGELAEIYGLTVAEEETATTLADHFAAHGRRVPRAGDVLPLGEIALVAHQVTEGRVVSVGLRLAEVEPDEKPPPWRRRLKQAWRKLLARLG